MGPSSPVAFAERGSGTRGRTVASRQVGFASSRGGFYLAHLSRMIVTRLSVFHLQGGSKSRPFQLYAAVAFHSRVDLRCLAASPFPLCVAQSARPTNVPGWAGVASRLYLKEHTRSCGILRSCI